MDHFSLLAPFYDRIFSFMDSGQLQRLLDLQGGEILLDIGGGTGRVSRTLADTARVVVVDESLAMLKEAKNKGLTVCRARVEALPFASGSVERILVVDAFHHFGDHLKAALEMMRVLRQGGRLVVEEPDVSHWAVKFIALGERLLFMRSRFYGLGDLASLLAEAGGKISVVDRDRAIYRVAVVKEE